MRMRLILASLLLGAGLGCAQQHRPVRGWIHQAGRGESFLDFRFVDERGVARSLRNLLGDYTVLALTRCDRDTHRPATAMLEEIVAENQLADFVRVVGVDIHWAEGGRSHPGACHLVDEKRNLVSLCDATGVVQRRYSADDGDKLYLINPEHIIIRVASVDGAAAFRRMLKEEVAKLSQARAEKFRGEPELLAE